MLYQLTHFYRAAWEINLLQRGKTTAGNDFRGRKTSEFLCGVTFFESCTHTVCQQTGRDHKKISSVRIQKAPTRDVNYGTWMISEKPCSPKNAVQFISVLSWDSYSRGSAWVKREKGKLPEQSKGNKNCLCSSLCEVTFLIISPAREDLSQGPQLCVNCFIWSLSKNRRFFPHQGFRHSIKRCHIGARPLHLLGTGMCYITTAQWEPRWTLAMPRIKHHNY